MDVTFGFMFRIDSYPPAVAVPPAVAPVQPRNQGVIDAEIVSEASAAARNNPMRSGMSNLAAMSRNMAGGEDMMPRNSAPLTYSKHGKGNFSQLGGTMLDLYA